MTKLDINQIDLDDDDMGAMWRDVKVQRQLKHSQMKVVNTKLIAESGVAYTASNEGESLIIRNENRPWVIFYPSSGRWVFQWSTNKKSTTFNGGAQAFLGWYRKQKTEDGKTCFRSIKVHQ